ncbi:MAG: acetylxylan esterase [Parabacteroides sp.]
MKHFLICIIALLTFGQVTHAQIRGNEIRVVVSPDHTDWTYELNEPCRFTVQVFKAQNLLEDAVIDYAIGPEMYPTETKEQVVLKTGKLELKGKMSQPGFFQCKVKAHVEGRTYEGLAKAAYAPAQIVATAENPTDFDSFWANAIEQARQTPLQPTMVLLPERCTEKVNVYHVSFQNVRPGSRTYGILCMPKQPGKYPALLRVPGAGIRPYYGDVTTAEKGAITLEIGIHGIPVTMTQDYYDKLFNGALWEYWKMNRDSREASYYYRVVLGSVRAVDFIQSLPAYNGQALGVTGSSQGGALSVMTAALHPGVTFYAAIHPAMCDHSGHLKKRAGGWPHYFYQQSPTEAQRQTAAYYDVVNFARRVKIGGWFSWGYNDEVCPPTSMFSAYNSITAPKEFHPYLETGHFWYQEQYDAWNDWLWKQMNL